MLGGGKSNLIWFFFTGGTAVVFVLFICFFGDGGFFDVSGFGFCFTFPLSFGVGGFFDTSGFGFSFPLSFVVDVASSVTNYVHGYLIFFLTVFPHTC